MTVEKAAAKERGRKVEVGCSFDNLVPKIANFYQAKGLTFDSVFLPRLTDKAYSWTRPDQLKRMMFVGIARATQWVYLSTVEGQEFGGWGALEEAATQGHLIVQSGADARRPFAGPGADDEGFSVL